MISFSINVKILHDKHWFPHVEAVYELFGVNPPICCQESFFFVNCKKRFISNASLKTKVLYEALSQIDIWSVL